MNEPTPDPQLDALFALARARRPDTSAAEYAFETRLLARLRAGATRIRLEWAMVSWRMIPFFAACVVALTLWQSQIVKETDDAAQAAYLENPNALRCVEQLESQLIYDQSLESHSRRRLDLCPRLRIRGGLLFSIVLHRKAMARLSAASRAWP